MSETSIILPTYNEKENIKRLIEEIFKIAKNVNIIVVDDNSPDGTHLIVEELSKRFKNLYLIKRQCKMGLGSAYITGFKYAKEKLNSKFVITMDCDFSHSPDVIPEIIKEINENDLVIGSRYTNGGKVIDSPIMRRFISKLANFCASYFVGIKVKDATSGFRGYRLEILEKINYDKIFSNGYSFLTEILYKISKIKNIKIKEIPITFYDRKYGKSKISKKEILKAIYTVIRLTIFRILIKKEIPYYNLVEKEASLLNPINYLSFIFHTKRYIEVMKMIKDGNILDIGCGKPSSFMVDGSFLIFIDRKESVGIDINDLKTKNFKFIKANVLNLPFQNESFDNIVAMEILEHIEEVDRALSEIKKVLKKDGVFIMSTPDNSLVWKIVWFLWSNSLGKMWQHKHLVEYKRKEWLNVVSRHFKVIKVKKHFFFDLILKCQKQ